MGGSAILLRSRNGNGFAITGYRDVSAKTVVLFHVGSAQINILSPVTIHITAEHHRRPVIQAAVINAVVIAIVSGHADHQGIAIR